MTNSANLIKVVEHAGGYLHLWKCSSPYNSAFYLQTWNANKIDTTTLDDLLHKGYTMHSYFDIKHRL
jgi:hypothetical protein